MALANVTERGTTGKIRWNKNGTFDMGVMQINSRHLPKLAKFGWTARDIINDECLNIYIGTWYLQSRIILRGNVWKGIGDYFSGTPDLNAEYQERVYKALQLVWEGKR